MSNENENDGLNLETPEEQPVVEQLLDGETPALEAPATEVVATEQPAEQPAEIPAEIPAGKPPVTVPVHIVEELRKDRREAEARALQAENELNSFRQQNVASQQKSPMQLAAEAQGIDTTQPGWKKEVVVDGELEEQQYAWRKNQDIAAEKSQSVLDFASQHPDFAQVCQQGEQHLTVAETNQLKRCTGDFGQKAYELCQKALVRAGVVQKPAPATIIPKVIPTAQSANNKASEPNNKKAVEPPTQDEILQGVSPEIQRAMSL